MTFTIRATIVQTPEPGRVELRSDRLITVDDRGVIGTVESAPAADADVTLPADQVLLPGMIDTHIHAPQWPQLGTGLDRPLERWLFDYTFPLEARYHDVEFAERVWSSMVPTLLGMGTTTAVYYGSIHEPATVALARACVTAGQRAFVGRVAMDHPDGTPSWYRDEGPEASVAASRRSIDEIRSLPGAAGLVEPIVTPRFIPACSDAALEGLGRLAMESEALVQTHCSESDWEHGYVLDRHGLTDAEALSRFGLVRDHAVLAHATHLTDDDRRLLIDRGAGVAHCPLSNAYFSNAVFAARLGLTEGLRIGLGTDIAGGSEPSLLAQCGHAVTASRLLEDGVDVTRGADRGRANSRIDVAAAFWMATGGGAELLGIPAGLLAPGRLFDAVAIDLAALPTAGAIDHASGDAEAADYGNEADLLERIVRTAPPSAIDRVWVGGRPVIDRGRSATR